MQINHANGRVEVIAQAILGDRSAVIRIVPQEGVNCGQTNMYEEGKEIARALIYALTGPARDSLLSDLLDHTAECCEAVGRDDMARVYRNAMFLAEGAEAAGLCDFQALEAYARAEADAKNDAAVRQTGTR